mgnify:CR=1 FL=1
MIPSRMMTLFVLISLAGHITVLSAAGLVGLSPEPAGEELFQVELTAPAPEDSTNRTALPRGFKKASGTPGLGRYRGEDTVELGAQNRKYTHYLNRLRQQIESRWEYPPEAYAKKKTGTAVLQFSIAGDGNLLNAVILVTLLAGAAALLWSWRARRRHEAEAAALASLPLALPCGGKGNCGNCRVVIQDGAVAPPTAAELRALTPAQRGQGVRLACQCRLEGNALIQVPPSSRVVGQKDLRQVQLRPVPLEANVKRYRLELPGRDRAGRHERCQHADSRHRPNTHGSLRRDAVRVRHRTETVSDRTCL